MKSEERYLLCHAAQTPIAIRAEGLLRIWPIDAPPSEAFAEAFASANRLDLCRSLADDGAAEKITIALQTEDGIGLVGVERIGGFIVLAEADFIALPRTFDFARRFFDAASRRQIDGCHPLRLRPDWRHLAAQP